MEDAEEMLLNRNVLLLLMRKWGLHHLCQSTCILSVLYAFSQQIPTITQQSEYCYDPRLHMKKLRPRDIKLISE